MSTCGCRCHVNPGAGCDEQHDTGSSGVPGAWSCSPCVKPVPADEACVLAHPQPAERFVGYLCRRHYHGIDRTLLQIEELFALLPDALLPGAGGDGRSATRVGSPSPGRIEVMALTDSRANAVLEPDDIPDLPGTLASWARIVVEERATTDVLTGNVSQSIRVLRREKMWVARQDWVDDYVGELHELHKAVARGVGDTMWPEPIGKCPNCRAPLYNNPTGADEITCRRCKSSWAGVAYYRLRLIFEQEAASRERASS